MLTGASFAQVYLEIVKAAIEKKELRDGTAFKMMPFECSSNGLPPLALLPLPLEPRRLTLHPTRWHPGMHGNYQWAKLQSRLDKIHAQLMLEVQDWRAQGTQQTALRKRGADSAVNSCVDYLAQQQERIDHEAPEGVSVGVDEANVCVWVATIFGAAAGFTVPHSAALVVRPLLPGGALPRRAWGLLCALRRSALAAQARPQSQHVVLPSSCASAAHRAPLDSCRSGGDALGRRHVPGGARLPARLSGRATVRALSHVHVPPAHQPAGRALLETPHHVEPSRAERKVRQLAADGTRAWSNAPPWQRQSRPPAALEAPSRLLSAALRTPEQTCCRAEPGPLGPRSAAPEPHRAAA